MTNHTFSARVYYEDTDAGGIMYHASHIKFAERARTEWLRSLGIDQSKLKVEHGLIFVVASLTIDYTAPAHLDDALTVTTRLAGLRTASMTLRQEITHGPVGIAGLNVTVACVDRDGRIARMPEALYNKLKAL